MFEEMTIKGFNEVLAGKSPTPGGGSALAIVGTIACALVEMSINVSLTKADEETSAALNRELPFFTRARERLSKLAEEDSAAFRHIIDCTHMPKATGEEQTARTNALQKAYHKAALVPLDVMGICREALSHAKLRVFDKLYQYVASDCKIGMDLFGNIIENSLENVHANTCLIKDEKLRKTLDEQGAQIAAAARLL